MSEDHTERPHGTPITTMHAKDASGYLQRHYDAAVSAMPTRYSAAFSYYLKTDAEQNIEPLLGEAGLAIREVDYGQASYRNDDDFELTPAAIFAENDNVKVLASQVSYTSYVMLSFTVHGVSQQALEQIHEQLTETLLPHRYLDPPTRAKITCWYMSSMGPSPQEMYIEAPGLDEGLVNYPDKVSDALAHLVEQLRRKKRGVHIWHGEPGTGKTSALRMMAQELKGACEIHLIMDPGQLLNGGMSYLLSVIRKCANPDRSYVLAMEDTGAMVKQTAGEMYGEALGRILNVTDGIIGQNSNVSVLITTNENVGDLHPALLRPGRCGSQIDFRSFDRKQAEAWCVRSKVDPALVTKSETTLAELYALLDDDDVVRVAKERRPIGFTVPDEARSLTGRGTTTSLYELLTTLSDDDDDERIAIIEDIPEL